MASIIGWKTGWSDVGVETDARREYEPISPNCLQKKIQTRLLTP